MKKEDVRTGGRYIAKVSGKLTVVEIVGERAYASGWVAKNVATGRAVTIKTGARLRREAAPGEDGVS